MRQRQLEFYQGWDEEEVSKRDPDEDGSGRGFQEELEGHDGGSAEEEALQAKEQAEKDEDDECEAVSTAKVLCWFCRCIPVTNQSAGVRYGADAAESEYRSGSPRLR